MAQRPVGVSRVARSPKPAQIQPEPRTAPGNPAPWSGRVRWIDHAKAHESRPAAETPATDGEPLPNVSAGKVCDRCGAYIVRPDLHADWHADFDRWARGMNRLKALVHEVFRARGYVTTTENTATTDGNTDDA